MARVDPGTGAGVRAAARETLAAVDEYFWADGRDAALAQPAALATRPSRAPSSCTSSTYSSLRRGREGRRAEYVLAHEFAFAERAGPRPLARRRPRRRPGLAGDDRARTAARRRGRPARRREAPSSGVGAAIPAERRPSRARRHDAACATACHLALWLVPLLLFAEFLVSEWRARPLRARPRGRGRGPAGWIEEHLLAHRAGGGWEPFVGRQRRAAEEASAVVARLTGGGVAPVARRRRRAAPRARPSIAGRSRATSGPSSTGLFFDGRTETYHVGHRAPLPRTRPRRSTRRASIRTGVEAAVRALANRARCGGPAYWVLTRLRARRRPSAVLAQAPGESRVPLGDRRSCSGSLQSWLGLAGIAARWRLAPPGRPAVPLGTICVPGPGRVHPAGLGWAAAGEPDAGRSTDWRASWPTRVPWRAPSRSPRRCSPWAS